MQVLSLRLPGSMLQVAVIISRLQRLTQGRRESSLWPRSSNSSRKPLLLLAPAEHQQREVT